MDAFDILNKEYGEGEGKYVVTKYCGLNPLKYHVYEVKFLETGNLYERVRTSVMRGKLVDTKKKVKITKEANLLKRKNTHRNIADSSKVIHGTFNVTDKAIVLDQATINTGYCIMENGIILEMGFIRQDRGKSLARRINSTKKEIRALIEKHGIKHIIIEDIFLSNNLDTYKALCSLMGVLIDMAVEASLSITSVMASVWRKQYGISGNRTNCKERAMNLVKTKFQIELSKVEEDLAEALLIALFIMEENDIGSDMFNWK